MAIPARVAFVALLVKDTLGLTAEKTVEQIWNNAYLQYFVGFSADINAMDHRNRFKEPLIC